MKTGGSYKQIVLLNTFLLLTGMFAFGQSSKMIRYFDSSWMPVSQDQAFFFTEMLKVDKGYQCNSYWKASGNLNCKSVYADTNFAKPVGLLLRYYQTGQTEDSTYFNEDGSFKDTYHFYPNGKIHVRYSYNPKSKKSSTEAYDMKGNRRENYVFHQSASFQEGNADWIAYLTGNLNTDLIIKNGAPPGTYEVMVVFMIGKNGKIANIEVLTNHGFGMEEEAIRVIKKSPKWNPEIYLEKPIDTYRKQPVIFVIKKK